MGEYIAASIKFGGRLPADKVEDLIYLLSDKDLTVDTDERTGPNRDNLGAQFGSYQINYGNLDELRDFAHENGLDYAYWHDHGPEWSAQTYRYYAGWGRTYELPTLHDGDVAVPLDLIRQLGSFHHVMDYVARVQAAPMPLEIVP